MNAEDKTFPVDRSLLDHAVIALRTVLASVQVPDGYPSPSFANELLPFISTPLQRRQEAWFNELGERVHRLEAAHGIDVKTLCEDPLFIDALLTATLAAQRTSSEIKLEAFRNLIVNSAIPDAPASARQQIFLAYTDRFSDLHLRLLRFAQDASKLTQPDGSPLPQRRGATQVLNDVFPEAVKDEILFRAVWTDLFNAGLVNSTRVENGAEGDARKIRRTTTIGDEYLAFITDQLTTVKG